MTGKQLTCREAADLIGVSVSTVKRMCNDGTLEYDLTPGGHRRVWQNSIQQFLKSQSVQPAVISAPLKSTEVLLDLLLQRQVETVVQYFEQLSEYKTVASVLDQVLVPVLWEIGNRWATGQMDIYQEHICSETANLVLDEWAKRLPQSIVTNPIEALGCAVGHEQHSLVSKMIALVFRSVGIKAICLGARIPVPSLLKAVQAYKPRVVWVTCTNIHDADELVRDNRTIHAALESDQSLVIGGRALTASVRQRMYFDFYGDSLTHLEHYAMQGKWRARSSSISEQKNVG